MEKQQSKQTATQLAGGIKSSGEKREFGTGAHRDSNTKILKGRMDLIPTIAMHRFAKFCTDTDFFIDTYKNKHSLYFYNGAMESMYKWLDGERNVDTFDHFSFALWHVQQMIHIDEDLPLWIPAPVKKFELDGLYNRFDKISPIFLRRVSIHYQLGGINYGDNNWTMGIPCNVLWDSAVRHLTNWLEREETEDHLAAFGWNVMGLMHTIEMINRELLPEELFDIPTYVMIDKLKKK